MTAPAHDTTHAAAAVSRLLSVCQVEDPCLVELVHLVGDQVQLAEDLVWELLVERYISTAVGVQLDAWGRVLGKARSGLTDDEYRLILAAWQQAHRSQGRGDQILRAMKAASGAVDVRVTRIGVAEICIDLFVSAPPLSTALRAAILEVAAACVASGVQYQVIEADATSAWIFDEAGHGYDDGLRGVRLI